MHILLVHSDPLLCHSMAFNLTQLGYRTSVSGKIDDALSMMAAVQPDLILLDVDLSEAGAVQSLQGFTAQVDVPIVFLVARMQEIDIIKSRDTQQHIFMVKPFDIDRLLDYIKTFLRPTHPYSPILEAAGHPLVIGDLTIDPASNMVTIGTRSLELPPREFALLHTLAHNVGKVMPIEELLATVWGPTYAGDAQVVYVHIRWLREKLEVDPYNPRRIITVRGAGYKLLALTDTPE